MGDFVIFGGGDQGAENGEQQRQHGDAGAHHRERGALFREQKLHLSVDAENVGLVVFVHWLIWPVLWLGQSQFTGAVLRPMWVT